MPKKPVIHPHSDELRFQRLMLLIATLVKHPGVGYLESDERGLEDHNRLQEVQSYLREVAQEVRIDLPEGYPGISTIRKDIETLRRYHILDQGMYRWGYYLGTGVMSSKELQVAFHALASVAKYQGNSQAKRVHQILTKRLRKLDLELHGEFFYPVRQQLNRAIVHTDPDEMRDLGEYRDTLFDQLDIVEQAIYQGQVIEISRHSDPYGRKRVGLMQVYPLQLVYYDIAWYLIYEYYSNGHLAISRINRFKSHCEVLPYQGRGLAAQKQSLTNVHQLLENGWGLYLGELEEQQAELQGKLTFQKVKVHFFPEVIPFILEGDRRHLHQKIDPGPKDKNGKPRYVEYTVKLPPRSLPEFSLWVYRHMDNAQIISPPDLAEKHRQAAIRLANRYNNGQA